MSLFLMAFAKSTEVKDAPQFDKYLGAVEAHLEAVNPTVEELKKILGDNYNAKTEYTSNVDVVDVEGNKKKGYQNMITLWYSINGLDDKPLFVKYTIFLSNSAYIGSRTGKIQVCDQYGRFAWATPEEYKANAIPQYKNGPANISKDYRCAMMGEEELIELIKCHLNIPKPSRRNQDGSYTNLTEEELEADKAKYACSFEPQQIIDLCKGNVKLLKQTIEDTNDVKLILGIKHGDKDYQTVYTVVKKNQNDLSNIEKDYNENGNKNIEILLNGHIPGNLMKWTPSATDVKAKQVEKPEESDLPF